MWLSDVSVKRPVLATVINALLVVFGLFALAHVSVREYPDIDPPIVSVSTNYPGASAAVVETKITQLLEDRIAGIEGLRTLSSTSSDGRSNITVEFTLSRDVDAAANDVRDRVARALGNLPEEADPPEISKADVDANPILWMVLSSDRLTPIELSDYADRYLVDRLGAIDGVSAIRIGGERRPAMRIWLDRKALAARGLTSADVETALRNQNAERPAGRLESTEREFTLRTARPFTTPADFAQLVVARGEDGYPVRLGELARVEVAPADLRNDFRANGRPAVGLGIIKQSKANTLTVARAAKAEMARIAADLPGGMQIRVNSDFSLFVEASLREVTITLSIAALLVVVVIFLFLGDLRATLIPALTVPISLVASFIFLNALGFSLNILTLLALVLAIGIVVDDTIVVVENIHRRMEHGEPPLLAAFNGAREVGFAVLATTVVLVVVFLPLALLEGNVGRLFREFALSLAAAVACSGIVALTLAPVLSAALLKRDEDNPMARGVSRFFARVGAGYRVGLLRFVEQPWLSGATLAGLLAGCALLYQALPREFTPPEDRGQFNISVRAPEGASYDYTARYMKQVEGIVLERLGKGEVDRTILRIPGFGPVGNAVNTGNMVVSLTDWAARERTTIEVAAEVGRELARLPGVRATAIPRTGFGQGFGQPVQVVLGGGSFEELAQWRDVLMARLAQDAPRLTRLDSDYKETLPTLELDVDLKRAGDLGVPVEVIGRTLETLLAGRRVTTYFDRGEEYDVWLQAEAADRANPGDLANIYVRSTISGQLIPLANVLATRETAGAASYNRYNRLRSITISAGLTPGYTLGEALGDVERAAAEVLPGSARLSYRGDSRELKESSQSLLMTFGFALLVVFLVLAAQFESFVHPVVIMTSVPLAVFGALAALGAFGYSLNIYSQIGVILLIGLAAKNGILIVEFANQRRDAGLPFTEALLEAAAIRLRPILMTSVATVAGAVPLVFSTGAGAESRANLGIVVFWGVLFSTLLTLYVVPGYYALLARGTGSPGRRAARLAEQSRGRDVVPDK
ncbi:MAG: efflux RND transporter permease subunit [Gammaproteobacteria bacterium]